MSSSWDRPDLEADIFEPDDREPVTIADVGPTKQRGPWPPVRLACVAITGPGTQGTGFLIDESRVLTAAHVIDSHDALSHHRIIWGKFTGNSPKLLKATRRPIVLSPRGLDYAIFGVEPVAWPAYFMDLTDHSDVEVGECVTVYGHPDGGPLRRSGLRDSAVIDVTRDLVRYRADATGGASGGPVLLSSTGRLVAIHLGGDPRSQGNRGLLIRAIAEELERD